MTLVCHGAVDMSEENAVESVDVVLLCEDGVGVLRPLGGDAVVRLDLVDEMAREALGALLDAAIRLDVPEDIDFEVGAAIAALPVPTAFRTEPWLHEHRVLVLRDGRCVVGGTRLRYRPGIGLYVDEHDSWEEL